MQIQNFWLTAFLLSLAVFGRYVLVAGFFQLFFRNIFREQFEQRVVQERQRADNQTLHEVGWSFLTSVIFGFGGAALLFAWQNGHTRIYLGFAKYSVFYYVFSIAAVLFIHETYYYWLHRWMHRPKVYRLVHKVHHDSVATSAWTSFSFHPIESVLQALVIPALALLMPLHYSAIALILLLMTVSSVINHLNTEIYPRGFSRHWFGRWWIGATHHSLHHSEFRYNFGLYFTFWDKWMRTESPRYQELFEKKTKGGEESRKCSFASML